MQVAQFYSSLLLPCLNPNNFCHYVHLHHLTSSSAIIFSVRNFSINRQMTTASRAATTYSSSKPTNNHVGGAFTTLKERVTFEKEIKKSKFIAIAGPVSDERSSLSFLSEVTSIVFGIWSLPPFMSRSVGRLNLACCVWYTCLIILPPFSLWWDISV